MTTSSSKTWRAIALVLRIVLGGIFVYAAWVKLREPWQLFALAIDSYRILPLWAVEWTARTLPWLELVIGVALIIGRGLRVSATVTSLLLVMFIGLLVRAKLKGMEISCGCFGNNEPLTWWTVLRDSSMLAVSLLLTAMAFGRERKAA
jgi:putative oxidoreductase